MGSQRLGLLTRYCIQDSLGVQYYYWDGLKLLERYNVTTATARTFTYGPTPIPGIANMLQFTEGGASYAFAYDDRGSAHAVSDASQGLPLTYLYDAHGVDLGHTGTLENPIQYQGCAWLSSADLPGIDHSPTRDYQAPAGRFIEKDPLRRRALDPYRYVLGNPLTYSDPAGLDIIISCPAKTVNKYLDAQGVTYTAPTGGPPYRYAGDAKAAPGNVCSEILARMISSKRQFVISGKDNGALANLQLHVQAHQNITTSLPRKPWGFALQSEFGLSSEFFQTRKIMVLKDNEPQEITVSSPELKEGASAFAAVEHMMMTANPEKDYAIPCQFGAKAVLMRGISLTIGEAQFNAAVGGSPFFGIANLLYPSQDVPEDDWIPGDYGRINNPNPPSSEGYAGEFIVYLGEDQWWGHPFGSSPLKGENGWLEKMKKEPWVLKKDEPGAKRGVVESGRMQPRMGLEREP